LPCISASYDGFDSVTQLLISPLCLPGGSIVLVGCLCCISVDILIYFLASDIVCLTLSSSYLTSYLNHVKLILCDEKLLS